MTDDAQDDVVVDARGSRCPMPVVEAARAARDRPAGTVLRVLSTDPATAHDLPAWCRMRGHELLDVGTGRGERDEGRSDQGEGRGDQEVVVRVRLR